MRSVEGWASHIFAAFRACGKIRQQGSHSNHNGDQLIEYQIRLICDTLVADATAEVLQEITNSFPRVAVNLISLCWAPIPAVRTDLIQFPADSDYSVVPEVLYR